MMPILKQKCLYARLLGTPEQASQMISNSNDIDRMPDRMNVTYEPFKSFCKIIPQIRGEV